LEATILLIVYILGKYSDYFLIMQVNNEKKIHQPITPIFWIAPTMTKILADALLV
jgi:hypothetical protein